MDANPVDPQYTPIFLESVVDGQAPFIQPLSTSPTMSKSPLGVPEELGPASSAVPVTGQEAMSLDSARCATATVPSRNTANGSKALGSQLSDGQLQFHANGGTLQSARPPSVPKPATPSTPPYIEYMKADHGVASSRVKRLGYLWIGLCIFLGAVLLLS